MSDREEFIQSLKVPNTIKVVKSVFESIGLGDKDISEYDTIQMQQLILNGKPNSPKAITTICYILSLYTKWLYESGRTSDDNAHQIVQSMDRTALWIISKPTASKKFISHKQYLDAIHDIGLFEEYNAIYYETLFSCLYEGIYSEDMSVVKNLRSSDIKGNIVTLREDNGNVYKLEISYNLAEQLIELAELEEWERKNRYGVCKIHIQGEYSDSCFKVEQRKETTNNPFVFSYYAKLRKISREYLEYNISPMQIYISGIMYRIREKLSKEGIELTDAFAMHNRNRLVGSIIGNELSRCNYNSNVKNFREIVGGHLEVFIE